MLKFLYSFTWMSIILYTIFSVRLLHVSEWNYFTMDHYYIMKLICSIWHIPIQILIACRQQLRWHTVITITDKLEIFIFCRQSPAALTFQLFSWACPVWDQYSSCPAEDWAMCAESFLFFHNLLFLIIIVRLSLTVRFDVCQKALCFWN